MFGSDFPKCAIDLEIEKILRHVKDEADREKIFHRTATTLFKELNDEN